MAAGHHSKDTDKLEALIHYLRAIKATLVLLLLVLSASVLLLFLAPLTFFLLRFFSLHWSRKLTSSIFGHWLAVWPFFFEKINRTRVIFYGDKVPDGERVLLLCNHRTEVDWMYIWILALRKRRIGNVKYVLKSSVRNAPVFGWAFHVLEFLPVDRKWQSDASVFQTMLTTFKDRSDPLWLVIFPEGTDYTEDKCLRSQKFAEEHGLPKLQHVLLPRTKGVFASLNHLDGSIDAVYNLTIGYKNRCPLFIDNALGTDPKEVHIHIKRIPASEIPKSENGISEFLLKLFSRKDELLSHFYKEGIFPDSGDIEGNLSMFMGIVNACIVMLTTCVLVCLIFSSFIWVKVYVAFSCIFLTAATYYNYKPQPIMRSSALGKLLPSDI